MQYTYKPEGVCSYKMIIEVEEDTIKKVTKGHHVQIN